MGYLGQKVLKIAWFLTKCPQAQPQYLTKSESARERERERARERYLDPETKLLLCINNIHAKVNKHVVAVCVPSILCYHNNHQ